MDVQEVDDGLVCAHCGASIADASLERAYLFAEDQALCYLCATQRGGVYDELDDDWVASPDVSGLFPDGDPEFGPRGVTI